MEHDSAVRPYLRTPSISPDGAQIAFVYAGDIWLVGAQGGDAQRLTAHHASHHSPRWSRDGSRIVFGSNRNGTSDLYIMSLNGGGVQRLTHHESAATPACWAPDDSAIYFTADRNGIGTAIYRVNASGGTPILWCSQPHEQLQDATIAPNNNWLAVSIVRNHWWRRGPNLYAGTEIWLVGNTPAAADARCVANTPGLSRWPLWDEQGQGLFYISDRSGHENLWYQPIDQTDTRQITTFDTGRMLWPSISANRRKIVFERDFGIWQLDPQTGQVAPIDIRVRPDQKFTPNRSATYSREYSELILAPDGKKLAFVIHGEVFADFADKETDKELRQGLALRVTNTSAREQHVAWTHDSRKLLYTSDRTGEPEVFAYDFASRAEARLTNSPRPKAAPLASPDGNWIAYISGDDEIRLIDLKNNTDQAFIQMPLSYEDASMAWSPDSQWLVFVAQDQHLFENLYVQKIGEPQAHQITFVSNLSSEVPLWAANGQFIIFTTNQYRSERQIARVDLRPPTPFMREVEFDKLFEEKKPDEKKPDEKKGDEPSPKPDAEATVTETTAEQPSKVKSEEPAKPKNAVEIAFAGIDRRLRLLTPPQIDASALCISADSRDLIFRASVLGKPNLWHMPLDEPRAETPARQLTSNGSYKWNAQFSPDGKLLYFLDGGQITIRKFPNGEQSTPSYYAEVQTDFHQEKFQLFHECHRLLRDQYYDPTFGGVDWQALKVQYAPIVAGCQTHGDLHALLNLMMGELRASHLSFGYHGQRSDRDGYLGIILDTIVQIESGRFVVAEVLPDSPATVATIAIGSEILAIDGQPLGQERSLDEALHRTAGRRVRLTITGPDTQGEREIILRPIGSTLNAELHYRAWVQRNEAIVHAASEGQIGYVHIPEMSYPAYQRFLVDLDAEAYNKQGIVIDVRFNGGGHTATFFLDLLARRSVTTSAFRTRVASDTGHIAGNRMLNRPTVLVTNERSYSNAEMFSETYRRLGIGQVVGKPTGGAVIWTWHPQLIDGASIGLPRLRITNLDGEDLEGTGRPVDHNVALPLGDPARGRDPQLETAVRVLLGLPSPPAPLAVAEGSN